MNTILSFSELCYTKAEQKRDCGSLAESCGLLGLSVVAAVGGVGLVTLKAFSDELGLSKPYYSHVHQNFLGIIQILSEDHPQLIADVRKYGIENPEQKIEIAKLCADKYPTYTANNFDRFGITNQSQIIEIAMVCARSEKLRDTGTTPNFNNFGIVDPAELLKIQTLHRELNPVVVADQPSEVSTIEPPLTTEEIRKIWSREHFSQPSHRPMLYRFPSSGPGSPRWFVQEQMRTNFR